MRLTLTAQSGEEHHLDLRPSAPLIIGRAQDADFRVVDPTVGMRVLRLELTPAGIAIDDLDSGGGSALEIDGEVTPRPHCLLSDGAVLRVGDVAFRVTVAR